MKFKPECRCSAVGSFPHKNNGQIVDKILATYDQIPVWPQLPGVSFRENMYIQYSENMPCLIEDEENEKIYFNTSNDIYGDLEKFYEKFLSEELDYFKMSEAYASGFFKLKDELSKQNSNHILYLKGQITGPVSFGLTITDEKRRSILYNKEIFEAVVKCLVMRTRWQVLSLKSLHPGVIIFIDEPYLSSFGSAFINITREEVISYLGEVISAIKENGALAGVHCCGNTDWSILFDTDTDIVNFDACEYFQGMTLYPEKLKAFLKRGGSLAWGIVPTSSQALEITSDFLVEDFEDKVNQLVSKGIAKKELLEQCLITPACGVGSKSVEIADRVTELSRDVSETLRKKYF